MAYETYADFQREAEFQKHQRENYERYRNRAGMGGGALGGLFGGIIGGPGGAMMGAGLGSQVGTGLWDGATDLIGGGAPKYDPEALAQEQLNMLQQKAYDQRLANMDYTRNAFAPANATLARLYGSEAAVPLPSQNELRSGPLARYYVPGAS